MENNVTALKNLIYFCYKILINEGLIKFIVNFSEGRSLAFSLRNQFVSLWKCGPSLQSDCEIFTL